MSQLTGENTVFTFFTGTLCRTFEPHSIQRNLPKGMTDKGGQAQSVKINPTPCYVFRRTLYHLLRKGTLSDKTTYSVHTIPIVSILNQPHFLSFEKYLLYTQPLLSVPFLPHVSSIHVMTNIKTNNLQITCMEMLLQHANHARPRKNQNRQPILTLTLTRCSRSINIRSPKSNFQHITPSKGHVSANAQLNPLNTDNLENDFKQNDPFFAI